MKANHFGEKTAAGPIVRKSFSASSALMLLERVGIKTISP